MPATLTKPKPKPPTTAAGGPRFIPIEANTAFAPSATPRGPHVLPKTHPPPGPPSYGLYPYPPPGHPPPPIHYNPAGAAHPYFFPPVLAHQPGAHFPNPHPPPPPQHGQAPPPPPPPSSTPAAPPTPSTSTPPTTSTPAPNSTTAKHDTTPPIITTAEHILERAKKAAAQTPNPATNTNSTISNVNINPRYPPKGVNSAARPTTHPNPQALGLTRISPPPECRYPSPEVINTVVNAWAMSRGYRLSRQKSDRNAAGDMYKQYYLCTRHGRPTNTHKVTPETRQRKQRKSERIGCPMGLVVRAVDASTPSGDWTVRWQLEGKSEWHNHGPATEEDVAAEKARAERNERRKASRGLGNGKRGRRLKDPDKPARKRDRRKKKPEPEGVAGGGGNAVEPPPNGDMIGNMTGDVTGDDSGTTSASPSTVEVQPSTVLPRSNEQQLQQGPEQQLDQGHAQQLQHELTNSLQTHDLSALAQAQHQHQHQQQPQHQHQHQYPQTQQRPRSQLSHSQATTQRATAPSQQQSYSTVQPPSQQQGYSTVQPPSQQPTYPTAQPASQQQTYATPAIPNLWGLNNANILTQHQQQHNQQQQQQQAYRSYAQNGMGYR